MTEVGGDDPDNVVDRLGAGNNENAAWVNAPGQSFASEKESCWCDELIVICLQVLG